jgi:hypothetical protein
MLFSRFRLIRNRLHHIPRGAILSFCAKLVVLGQLNSMIDKGKSAAARELYHAVRVSDLIGTGPILAVSKQRR